jgi:hypothetical protein
MMNRRVCRLALIHELGAFCEPKPHRDDDTDCFLQNNTIKSELPLGPNPNLPNEMFVHRGSGRTLSQDSSILPVFTARGRNC